MALQGDVETMNVREILAWLAERRASGTLSLSRGMVVWRFHLQTGRVVVCSSAAREDLLGQLLLERGMIDEAHLVPALEESRRTGKRLGQVLTRSGLVSREELSRLLAQKIDRLLDDAMTWTDGRFFFDEQAPTRRRAGVPTSVDLRAVVQRPPAPRRHDSDPDALLVADADVLEVTDLGESAQRNDAETAAHP